MSYENNTGLAQVDINQSGALVYVEGSEDDVGSEMTWLDRRARPSRLRGTRAAWNNPRFAPDGRRLAIDIGLGRSRDIWVYDIGRDVASRLTFAGTDNAGAVWSPDGQYVAYRSNRNAGQQRNIYVQRADGSGDPVALTDGAASSSPSSWHPNGRLLAINHQRPGRLGDVMVLEIERSPAGSLSPGAIRPLLTEPAAESNARFSPDGRWLAYVSNESGRNEVYVRPFPEPGGKWQVSSSGGEAPEWSRRSEQLVYADLSGQKHVVPYSFKGEVFVPGSPVPWPGSAAGPSALGRGWALHPDGDRLVLDYPDREAPPINTVTLVTRMSDELRRPTPQRP